MAVTLGRSTAALALCMAAATATARPGTAEPPPEPPVPPAAGSGVTGGPPSGPGAAPLASGAPGTLTTPDGWVLSVSAVNESIEPVSSLTNAPWSREYLVDGTFVGTVSGPGITELKEGTLEAGYQIGCGILQDGLESVTQGELGPGISIPDLFPVFFDLQVETDLRYSLKPGVVNIVPVGRSTFTDTTSSRVSVTGYRVSIDACEGQSFIRSYATLTSTTADTADVVTYLGVTRAV